MLWDVGSESSGFENKRPNIKQMTEEKEQTCAHCGAAINPALMSVEALERHYGASCVDTLENYGQD